MIQWINELFSRLVVGAVMPLYDFLLDPASRYFRLYCVSGLVAAVIAYKRHKEVKGLRETLTGTEVWTSKSAINDYVFRVITPMIHLSSK